MTTTATEPLAIYAAMSAVMSDMDSVGKTGTNKEQGYKFRSIEDVLKAAHTALVKHGVFFLPKVLSRITEERETRGNKAMNVVHLEIEYTFYASDGSSVTSVVWGEGADMADKSTNKAMSQALKYNLVQALCISAGDVADPDASAEEAGPRRSSGRSAGDAWENAAPASPRNGGRQERSGQQRPAPARVVLPDDDSWRDKIADLATGEEANAAWAEIIGLRTDGTINDARAEQLKGAIRYHMAVRSQPEQPPQEDPWQTPAPPADGNGQPPAAAQPPRIRPEDQGAKKPAPPAGQDDDGWVTAWSDRLKKATADDLGGLQREIGAAVMNKTITAATAQDLSNLLREHRKVLNQAPAA